MMTTGMRCYISSNTQEDEEGEPMLPEESNALLRKWHALTPARRNAVLRLGWDYIDVPIKWTTQNHSQFPADFRQKVAAVAQAWQLPAPSAGAL
jgi:hypothetical protein